MCKLGKSAAQTQQTLDTVYSDNALKKSAMYDGYNRFKSGQESLEHEPRSGRPSTSRSDEMVAKMKQLVRGDRRITIYQVANELGISYGSAQTTVTHDVRRKRPEMRRGGWMLHQDNAPSHTAMTVQEFLAQKNIAVMPQPPYSLDLAPFDF
jgi:hypothetical protein